ncbi:hypothetical protein [Streptomyces sp. NBC_01190]|uniref:hypothetical protein n=1 Tax=Streptomyces sp. NBC_01190 TaxID=2903767 RepID=UPI003862FF68|nr:hypothetical protein OG519_29800 [Streptomyces sp. NBC_01190]
MKKYVLLLVGALLALSGGVPLAERLYAHLTLWGFGVPGYGPPLIKLALALAGVAALVLATRLPGSPWRRSRPEEG